MESGNIEARRPIAITHPVWWYQTNAAIIPEATLTAL